MPWANVDDGFWGHPKVADLMISDGDGLRALGLWVLALSWAYRHTIDKPPELQGVLPHNMIQAWDRSWGDAVPAAELLADAELWDRLGGGAYRIHDFREWAHLDLREQKQRAGRTGAQRRWHPDSLFDAPANGSADSSANGSADSSATGAPITSTSTSTSTSTTKDSPASAEFEFERFYWAYPRHKSRAQAERAWVKAVTRADPEVIIAAAARLTEHVEQTGKPVSYVPYPATWLNADGWADEDEDDTGGQRITFPS